MVLLTEVTINPYIESIVEPCVFKNQKGSSLWGFDWKENPERCSDNRTIEKSIPMLKVEFVCVCVCVCVCERERKK